MAKRILSFCLYAAALVITGLLMAFQLRYFDRLPDATEFYRPAGTAAGIPVEHLRALQDTVLVTGTAPAQAQVSTATGKRAAVQILYTDRFYGTVYQPRMKLGSFWTAEGAVISDQLAGQLFLSKDCIGAELRLGGRCYVITGVYQTDRGFAARTAPQPHMILPFLEGAEAEMVAFPGGEAERYYLSQIHDSAMSALSSWISVRLRPEGNLLLLLDQWVLLLVWMLCLCRLIPLLLRHTGSLKTGMQKSLRSAYGRKALWENRAAVMRAMEIAVLTLVLSAGVLFLVTRPLTLPADAFVENIFSPSAWQDFLTDRIRRPLTIANPAAASALFQGIWAVVATVAALLSAGVLTLAGMKVKGATQK